jgi:hypothetical protein
MICHECHMSPKTFPDSSAKADRRRSLRRAVPTPRASLLAPFAVDQAASLCSSHEMVSGIPSLPQRLQQRPWACRALTTSSRPCRRCGLGHGRVDRRTDRHRCPSPYPSRTDRHTRRTGRLRPPTSRRRQPGTGRTVCRAVPSPRRYLAATSILACVRGSTFHSGVQHLTASPNRRRRREDTGP